MKYARKMMVVPYSTPVGSSADAQNVNMSVSLMKNIPNNEKNKLYLQSLSKLRELSETLRPEDKFRETVSKLIENIEEEVKKDSFDTEDIQEIEKKEYQENASKNIKDYSQINNFKPKRQANIISKRELASLNVNNIIDKSDKKLTRGARTKALAAAAAAENNLKQNTAEVITPSNSDNIDASKQTLKPILKPPTLTVNNNTTQATTSKASHLQEVTYPKALSDNLDKITNAPKKNETEFRAQIESSLHELTTRPVKKRKLRENNKISQDDAQIAEKILVNQQQVAENTKNTSYREAVIVTDDDSDDEYDDANNAIIDLDTSRKFVDNLSQIIDESVAELGPKKVAAAINLVQPILQSIASGTKSSASKKQTAQSASLYTTKI